GFTGNAETPHLGNDAVRGVQRANALDRLNVHVVDSLIRTGDRFRDTRCVRDMLFVAWCGLEIADRSQLRTNALTHGPAALCTDYGGAVGPWGNECNGRD